MHLPNRRPAAPSPNWCGETHEQTAHHPPTAKVPQSSAASFHPTTRLRHSSVEARGVSLDAHISTAKHKHQVMSEVMPAMDLTQPNYMSMDDFLAQMPPIGPTTKPTSGVRFDDGDRAYDTDESWTIEDAIGTFYADVRQQLHAFAASTTQRSFTTTHFSKSQRRYVHATAHLLGLEHVSIGSRRRFRQMVISKPAPLFADPASFLDCPEEYLSTSAPAGQTQYGDALSAQPVFPLRSTLSLSNIVGVAPGPGEDGYETERTITRKKRKRVPKQEGAFACSFDGCLRVFDRASDRKKHEQVHQPSLTHRHRCEQCGKGFRYPKDLRRHLRTHGADVSSQSTAPRSTTAMSESSLVGLTPMTGGSEAESIPSLSFASQASSTDLVATWLDAHANPQDHIALHAHTESISWTDSKSCLSMFTDVEEHDEIGSADEDFLEMGRLQRAWID